MSDGANKPNRSARFIKVLGALVVFVAAGATGLVLWSHAQAESLRQEFASHGYPTSLAELNAWYEAVPDAENAALGFLSAAKAWVAPATDDETKLPIVGTANSDSYTRGGALTNISVASENKQATFDETTLRVAADYLAKNTRALELAHAASQLKKSRYPIDLSVRPGPDIDHLTQIRVVARLLWLEARVNAAKGDTAGAVRSFAAADTVARSLSREPLLIAQLVVVAIDYKLAEELCGALSTAAFKPAELAELEALLKPAEAGASFTRAIAGESVAGLFDNSPNNPMSYPIYALDRRAYASHLRALLEASALKPRDGVVRIEKLGAQENASLLDRITKPMASLVVPGLARGYDAFVRAAIARDLMRLVLAIETYRATHGDLPDDLKKIVPTIPDDPYSKDAYQYLHDANGYAVYSVGPDRIDQKGAKFHGPKSGDIALRVNRPTGLKTANLIVK